MQPREIFILQFNSETLYGSHNLTVLYRTICNRCHSDRHRMPEPYATVRRRLLAENKYIHEPVPGYAYKIIERQLIKKPIQQRLSLFQDSSVKQSVAGEPAHKG